MCYEILFLYRRKEPTFISTSFVLLFFLFLQPFSLTAAQRQFFVATNGSDASPGTLDEPWRTIQYAANTAVPGSTVFIHGGVYVEQITVQVSGDAGRGYITFRNVEGEVPIIDGTGQVVLDNESGLFYIEDQRYIRIQGLEIRNYSTSTRDRVPVGVHVRGESHHIDIVGNRIHGIATHAQVDIDLAGADAHGIAVFGTSVIAITDVTIDGNEIYNFKLGSSEALVINGNVDGFSITNNDIHDIDNIAIDCIGFEETAPAENLDQARNGVISGNTVSRVSSFGNPAYGDEYGAGGIYIDGGRDIVVERNTVTEADIGIEIASEHAGKATSGIIVRNNVIFKNNIAGIALGGYDDERGSTENCVIVNNTLFKNDTIEDGNGELLIQYFTENNTIKNNIFYAGPQSILIENPYPQVDNDLDYNLYFAPDGSMYSQWQWGGVVYTGYTDFRSSTGYESDGYFLDPLFTDADDDDFRLQPGSPAIDAGQDIAEIGDTDRDGRTRRQEGGVDIGAYEHQGPMANEEEVLPAEGDYHISIYPNPFRMSTSIDLILQDDQSARIAIVDILGRQKVLLHDGFIPALQSHTFPIDGTKWPAGFYMVCIVGDRVNATHYLLRIH